MLVVLRLALFSYWIDTYTGAGALAAIGGALVLGALPRIRKHFYKRDFFWMALGMAVLANTRPYEGLLVCVPAVAALAWCWARKRQPSASVLIRRTTPAAAVIFGTIVFFGYYDYRVFGNVFTLPYKVNRQIYAMVPHFLWQSPRPEPAYRHRTFHDFYAGLEAGSEMKWYHDETRSVLDLLESSGIKLLAAWQFYLSFALLIPFLFLPRAVRDRRIRVLVITGVVVVTGLAVETFFIQHYLAPATVLLYAVLLQCMRHLRVSGPSGLFLVRAIPLLCVSLAMLRTFAQPLRLQLSPEKLVVYSWYGSAPVGLDRARIARYLESLPGPQLALVAYSPGHMLNDWVYNEADIDKSKVVWARQMYPAADRELLNYYKDRKAWLIDQDHVPARISPYPKASSSCATGTLPADPNHCQFQRSR
jgi:hypothetical protein